MLLGLCVNALSVNRHIPHCALGEIAKQPLLYWRVEDPTLRGAPGEKSTKDLIRAFPLSDDTAPSPPQISHLEAKRKTVAVERESPSAPRARRTPAMAGDRKAPLDR